VRVARLARTAAIERLDPYATVPQVWLFNDQDRATYSGQWWSCPTRLVTGGVWGTLWRDAGTCRGGGIVSSVLPVLCLHTWPGKTQGADERGVETATWTAWTHLSHRRIARLAGVNTEAVGQVFRRLADRALLQSRTVPPPARYGGPPRREYRLPRALYGDGSPFVQVFGNLFYGGMWSMLPTPAARHLYLTIACLDPVLNDDAMRRQLSEDNHDTDIEPGALAEVRARKPCSLSALAHASGMRLSTVEEALAVLTTPVFDCGDQNISLVAFGPAAHKGMRWVAPDRRANRWDWLPEALNDPRRVEAMRRQMWPAIAARQDATKRRRNAKQVRDDASRRSAAARRGWERRRSGQDGR
jgi:hypothetical protein